MLITPSNFAEAVQRFTLSGYYGCDTETTGLSEKDRLFSLILSDAKGACYFNFNHRPDHLGHFDENLVLPRSWLSILQEVFANEGSTFFIHNAKFDMRMLGYEGLDILGTVHCTYAMERILHNTLGPKAYNLDACMRRRGGAKDDRVSAYIKEHKLSTKYTIEGKDKVFEALHYDLVPLNLISEYGAKDGEQVLYLGLDQMLQLQQLDRAAGITPKLEALMNNERKLTKVCHRMERAGFPINREYTKAALAHTQATSQRLQATFQERTGVPFQDSAKVLQGVFEALGVVLPRTPTGLPATNKEALGSMDLWLATLIQDIRHYDLLSGTYFSSFLHFADSSNLIHPTMWQAGTVTGRFSYSEPNLQNLPKEDEEEDRESPYLVRRCFVPLGDSWRLCAIDYKQQEFRLMLDYAGEHALIMAVRAGEDVHEATAKLLGISRKFAKTLNFGLLYGMGAQKLARALKVSVKEATEMRHTYFHKLPKVRAMIKQVMDVAQKRRWIYNWAGFRYHLTHDDFAYQLPNHLIQGSGAQVIRFAMTRLQDYIVDNQLRSYLVAQVHDELVFMVYEEELQHIASFKAIMESIYPPLNGLNLDCSVETSKVSLAKWDMEKWVG